MAPQQPPSSYTSYQHFLITTPAPFVAHVEINRPAKLNAFHEAMWQELRAVFRPRRARRGALGRRRPRLHGRAGRHGC
jgi:1,4-dihydroxy-2-naphthoyl-CoA synthase